MIFIPSLVIQAWKCIAYKINISKKFPSSTYCYTNEYHASNYKTANLIRN